MRVNRQLLTVLRQRVNFFLCLNLIKFSKTLGNTADRQRFSRNDVYLMTKSLLCIKEI